MAGEAQAPRGLAGKVQMSFSRDDIRISPPNIELDVISGQLKKDCLLFYYPDTEPLARKICEVSSKVELGEVKWA